MSHLSEITDSGSPFVITRDERDVLLQRRRPIQFIIRNPPHRMPVNDFRRKCPQMRRPAAVGAGVIIRVQPRIQPPRLIPKPLDLLVRSPALSILSIIIMMITEYKTGDEFMDRTTAKLIILNHLIKHVREIVSHRTVEEIAAPIDPMPLLRELQRKDGRRSTHILSQASSSQGLRCLLLMRSIFRSAATCRRFGMPRPGGASSQHENDNLFITLCHETKDRSEKTLLYLPSAFFECLRQSADHLTNWGCRGRGGRRYDKSFTGGGVSLTLRSTTK